RVQAVHTPGHTPEHMSFIITDTAGADEPMGVMTGDFIFVGDVGRPDLLEKAAGVSGTMEAGARQLFQSLQKARELPDWLQLWPGHGAGSACGRSLGAVPSTTLGYEKRFNWAFGIEDEGEFIAAVLAGQPEPPKYFAQMKRINREGPRVLGGMPRPERQEGTRLEAVLGDGAVVVDTRAWSVFRHGHVPGTINIPLNRSFTTWAGWLLPYDADFYLIADETAVAGAAHDLAMIGLDRIAGWFDSAAVAAYGATHSLETLDEMTVEQVHALMEERDVAILDVRGRSEYDAGHIDDVTNIPLGYLLDRIAEIPAGRPLVLQCQGGGRSAISGSLLAAHGVPYVINLKGGFSAWTEAGLPVAKGEPAAAH
ncbi:MAG TPA: rhodanese-like domain-containing protein, partial [Longimicrobiales bacterium]|nr:rhodanese-like domain-containing protein [Longimicrobiales bacterium]